MTDGQKYMLTGAAAVEGISYALLVLMAASFMSWPVDFRPSIGGTYMQTITSAVWPLLAIYIFANVHKVIQYRLCRYGPKLTGGLFLLDAASSVAPLAAFGIALIIDLIQWPRGGYYGWVYAYLLFIALIAGDSVVADIRALRRYDN